MVPAFAEAIDAYGFDAYFGKTLHRYLAIDGWKYWAFVDSEELHPGREMPGNSIINRSKVAGEEARLARGDPPKDETARRGSNKTNPEQLQLGLDPTPS